MSAYIVSHNHINAIVKFAGRHGITAHPGLGRPALVVAGNEQAIAELLLRENTRSVNHRYGETTPASAIVFSFEAPELSPIEAIKACNGLDYQSCETDDWQETAACRLLLAIQSCAVRLLPGYEEAAWEIAER